MDRLQVKQLVTSRGFGYNYYVSPAESADTSRPALLLCHGWPDSAALYKDVLPRLLASRLRILVPDLLGFGDSAKPTEPKNFEISAVVADVLELVNAEHISSPLIPIGHDWGSYFVQRLYLLHPERMAGLVTLAAALQVPTAKRFDLAAVNAASASAFGYPLYAYWDLFADPLGPTLMEQHLDSVWHALHGAAPDWMRAMFCVPDAFRDFISSDRTDVALKPYAQDERLREAWIEMVRAGGLTAAGCWYRAMKDNVHLATEQRLVARGLAPVENPYLFIGCDGDAVCRPDAIDLPRNAGLVPDLEVKVLHSGHWCPLEKPDEVADTVLDWLQRKGFAAPA